MASIIDAAQLMEQLDLSQFVPGSCTVSLDRGCVFRGITRDDHKAFLCAGEDAKAVLAKMPPQYRKRKIIPEGAD